MLRSAARGQRPLAMPTLLVAMQDRSERHGKRLVEHWNERSAKTWPTQQARDSMGPSRLTVANTTYLVTLSAVFVNYANRLGSMFWHVYCSETIWVLPGKQDAQGPRHRGRIADPPLKSARLGAPIARGPGGIFVRFFPDGGNTGGSAKEIPRFLRTNGFFTR